MQSGHSSVGDIQKPDFRSSLLRILMILTIILLVLNIFITPGQINSISNSVVGWLILIMLIIIPLSPVISIIKTLVYLATADFISRETG